MWQRAQQFDALVRVWAVTNHIAQTPNVLPLSFCIFQDGLEGGQVSMNIGDDENTHNCSNLWSVNGHYYRLSYHALIGRASLIILIITGFTKNSELRLFRSFWVSTRHQMRHILNILGCLLTLYVLGGCVQLAPPPPLIVPTTVPATNSAYPWTDEMAVMSGICFEA